MSAAVLYFFFLPETVSLYESLVLFTFCRGLEAEYIIQGGKSLEEIAALFGDEMAVENVNDVDPNAKVLPTSKHVEVDLGHERSKV